MLKEILQIINESSENRRMQEMTRRVRILQATSTMVHAVAAWPFWRGIHVEFSVKPGAVDPTPHFAPILLEIVRAYLERVRSTPDLPDLPDLENIFGTAGESPSEDGPTGDTPEGASTPPPPASAGEATVEHP